MNSKMATESAKVIYGKDKTIVEPVFGQIKNFESLILGQPWIIKVTPLIEWTFGGCWQCAVMLEC